MKSKEYINIRDLQHYMYCPHRWGLLKIDDAWVENYFVTRANLMHARTHSGEEYTGKGKRVYTSVHIWDDELCLYGVADCIEETKDGISIVEYKPTSPQHDEFREEDAMQVYAQKVCADRIFKCDSTAILYYADKHKRVKLPFITEAEKYKTLLMQIIREIRELNAEGVIPKPQKGVKCNGCSMRDVCIPSTQKRTKTVRQIALKCSEGEEV